jgi:peptide/nickel transport system permease protein
MLRYIVRRLLWLIPILICVSFLIYALMDLAPGTVIDSMITESTTEEDIQRLREQYDLDKPMVYRYVKYMWGLLHGDLGKSEVTGISVWDSYISRFPATLSLSLAALVIGLALSIPLGIFAARHAGTIWDNLTTGFTLIGLSMPSFWLGLLLLIWFSYKIKIFPAGGNVGIMSFILPAVTSGLMMAATATRQTRSSMLEVIRSDFLRTARAKGVPERHVIFKHALKNAWIPILTTIGNTLARTLAGSAVVESVFSWPGVGRLTVEAVAQRDVTLACGCVIMTSILYVVLLLIVDLLYAMVDPRIKAQYAKGSVRRRRRALA